MSVEWERVLRDTLSRNSKDPDETAAAEPQPAERVDVSWSTIGGDIEVPGIPES
jgi:hypothetical protein